MKIIRDEFAHDYDTYRFGYCEYAQFEPGDDAAALYAQGYLPYSADPNVRGRFYMARSARVPLAEFSFTSENRRIAKRFDGVFASRAIVLSDAQQAQRVTSLFLTYFAGRHGERVMSEARLAGILETPLPLRVTAYEKDGVLTAAVLEIQAGPARHFWFSAYDLSLTQQSLGMWLMLDRARAAQNEGAALYYLGTAYGTKALYKTNLEPLEYWNGSVWNRDITALKALARSDAGTLPETAGRRRDVFVGER